MGEGWGEGDYVGYGILSTNPLRGGILSTNNKIQNLPRSLDSGFRIRLGFKD